MRPIDETEIDEPARAATQYSFEPTGRTRPTSRAASGTRQTDREQPSGVVETGTTVVGAAGADGIVLAGDTRASVGGGRFVANRTVRKVEPVGERTAVAFSGSVSDARAFVRKLRSESHLYEMRHGRPPSVSTTATVAGDLVRRGPYRALDLVLAGVDDDGSAVYDIGPGGGVMCTDYAASGSGMQLAYGGLEGTYEPERPVSDLRSTVATAVLSATERDTASGDGMTIATITGEGLEIDRFDVLEAAVASTTEPDAANGEEVA